MADEIVELKNLEKQKKSDKDNEKRTQGGTVLENDAAVKESNGTRRLHDVNGRSVITQYDDLASEEKQRKERWVDKMIESGIDRVKLVKPNMLKGQLTNSLEKAMHVNTKDKQQQQQQQQKHKKKQQKQTTVSKRKEKWRRTIFIIIENTNPQYSSKLKGRAHLSSLDEEELKAIGMSMEEYAFHLIEPLKNDIIKRAIFEGKEFDRIAEKAVLLKQKKFLAHPVMYDLLRKRWARRFYYWKYTTVFERDWFKWMFLNFWTLFDIVLFPVIYFILYLIHKFGGLRKRKGTYRRDAFAIYKDYFTTPYFIFLRDTMSYFVLLALHFVMSIQPSTLHFSVVEWIILLFFLGRFMMEVYQAVNGLKNEKEIIEERITKRLRNKLSRMLYKYLR